MDLLSTHVAGVRVPRGGDKVYKDECSFSFDTPESDGGLFVCLSTFLGFSREFVELHYRKTGHTLYLNIQRRRIEEPTVEKAEDAPPNKKPTKMALGKEVNPLGCLSLSLCAFLCVSVCICVCPLVGWLFGPAERSCRNL
jgi:ubiquitin carboxyl-terminal hydrolase 5/13